MVNGDVLVIGIDLREVEEFARKAHEGQVRKYTGEPYVEHCIEVADMVKRYMDFPNLTMIAAALLHDTVEDCDVEFDDIVIPFGADVAEAVWYLTKPREFVGNRQQRKKLDRARLALAPMEVRFIKICDIMHNATSIKELDKNFWNTFQDEVFELLDAMHAYDVWYTVARKEHREVYHNFMRNVLEENL